MTPKMGHGHPIAAHATLAGLLLALLAPAAWAQEPPPAAPWTAPPPADPPAALPPTQPPPQYQRPAPELGLERPSGNVNGLGATLSFSTGAGFAYRRQWGATSLQLSAFGYVTDRGNSTLVSVGALIAQRLHVWHGASRGLLPAISALRVLGGVGYFLKRDVSVVSVPLGSSIGDAPCYSTAGCSASVTTNSGWFNGGAGIGFEFGAIDRPGISMTLDAVLTAAFKDGAFSFFLPLPQLAVLYNW